MATLFIFIKASNQHMLSEVKLNRAGSKKAVLISQTHKSKKKIENVQVMVQGAMQAAIEAMKAMVQSMTEAAGPTEKSNGVLC